ncbi:MAG TPA: lysylphosphatidylglycerol synthase domain-containing protein [Gaiellaceae bacterium]|nr:lysylphosphatidylglycerol synthase domain-containing protein [Gaiellaceae bacterium]
MTEARLLRTSPLVRRGLTVGSMLVTAGLAVLAVRHFAGTPWPLSRGEPGLLVAAGLLLLLAQALKALGWGRLFRGGERPSALALAAGNGGAALVGVVLPGRFDDVTRVAVVRRYPGCPAGVRVLCLSLVMLGLLDSVALAPLALAGAVIPGTGLAARAGLGVVAAGGIAATALIVALPRLTKTKAVLRFRLGRWVKPRTTSLRAAAEALALVAGCWVVRAVAVFLLLGGLGIGFSLSRTLLFVCAGAAAAALPIGPAGAATQIGAAGASLVAAGVGTTAAFGAAVSMGALGVLSGTFVMVFALTWTSGAALARHARAS